MIKKYYEMLCASRTMKIQLLQMLNGLFMLISPATLPGLPSWVYVGCAAAAIALGYAQSLVRVLPDHGDSLTEKQSNARMKQ